MKKVLLLSLLTSSMFGMDLAIVRKHLKNIKIKDSSSKIEKIDSSSMFVPTKLGNVDILHGKDGFYVQQDGKKQIVKKHFTDKMLRNINKDELKTFLKNGYLSLNQMEDGDYSLKANYRVKGGGPVAGTIAYWVTKSICYAVGFAAIGSATVATGGIVGGVVGGATVAGSTALATTAIATTTGATIATTAGVVTAGAVTGAAVVSGATATATVVGGVVGGTVVGTNAALATGAVVTGAGGIGATIAGIESLSVAVGTFFGMMPTI